jgi:predicted DNA-binding protein
MGTRRTLRDVDDLQRPVGRPRSGADGERVSDYPQVTVRLPRDTRAALNALSGMTGRPIWRLIADAVDAYVEGLPDDERRLLRNIKQRRAQRP